MKKIKLVATLLLLSCLAISVIVLTGCGTKKSSGDNTQDAAASGRKGFSAENIKEMLDKNLSSLVQDGTITADQEDKVISTISDSMSKRMASITRAPFNEQGNKGNRPSPGAKGSTENGQWRQGGSNGGKNGGTNGGTGQRGLGGLSMYSNELKSLVTDGTLTQAQSDAIVKALSNGFGGMGGGNGGFNRNGNKSGNNNTTQQ